MCFFLCHSCCRPCVGTALRDFSPNTRCLGNIPYIMHARVSIPQAWAFWLLLVLLGSGLQSCRRHPMGGFPQAPATPWSPCRSRWISQVVKVGCEDSDCVSYKVLATTLLELTWNMEPNSQRLLSSVREPMPSSFAVSTCALQATVGSFPTSASWRCTWTSIGARPEFVRTLASRVGHGVKIHAQLTFPYKKPARGSVRLRF